MAHSPACFPVSMAVILRPSKAEPFLLDRSSHWNVLSSPKPDNNYLTRTASAVIIYIAGRVLDTLEKPIRFQMISEQPTLF